MPCYMYFCYRCGIFVKVRSKIINKQIGNGQHDRASRCTKDFILYYMAFNGLFILHRYMPYCPWDEFNHVISKIWSNQSGIFLLCMFVSMCVCVCVCVCVWERERERERERWACLLLGYHLLYRLLFERVLFLCILWMHPRLQK